MRSEELDEAMHNIIDAFSGSDGGIKFFKFKTVVEKLDKQAQEGDEEAIRCIEYVKKFSDLLNICEKVFDENANK